MENTIKTNNDEIKVRDESGSISEVTEELLLDARSSLENKKTISVPIGKLSSLGIQLRQLLFFQLINYIKSQIKQREIP